MNAVIEELSACRRKLTIEVPADEVRSEFDQALSAYVRQASLPGFRPGKAPAALVKSRFRKQILEHLRDQLLPKSYHEALAQHKLRVVQIVEMEDPSELNEQESLRFGVTVDIQPDFPLPAYKTLSLKREVASVEPGEIDQRIEVLREQRADFEEVKDRPAARGDMVQIDFTARLDGQPLGEVEPEAKGLGEGKDFWLPASDEAFIPELGLALAGLSIGSRETLDVTFPGDFTVKGLRGRAVQFEVEVKALRARKLPELDKDFFEKLGVKDEADFRDQVGKSLTAEKERMADAKLREAIEMQLLAQADFELPESLVDEAARDQIRRIAGDLQRGGQETALEENKDQILDAARQAAGRQVKLRLLLNRIAEEEKLQASEAELKREIRTMAYSYAMQPDELEKRLRQNNRLEDLRGDLICRKVMDLIQKTLSAADAAQTESA